jgi:transposase-like protein
MGFGEIGMKIVVKVKDVVELVRRFETSPAEAMREVVGRARQLVVTTLEQVMDTEMTLFLGDEKEASRLNKRNGYRTRRFAIKGVGEVELKVPRDRAGRFETKVVPERRHYDRELEKDLALLHLAGLSTRMLSQLSRHLLGLRVSSAEVANSLREIVPAARKFLERPLGGRRFVYLYVDGTNFRVRRSTVAIEPTLVVVGVDDTGHKSILAMTQGDKDSRPAWELVFADLKVRGLDGTSVQLGIMDGLPGLGAAFVEAFPSARVARCWVHKARNVFPLVPRRYQEGFRANWDAVQYADSREAAQLAFEALDATWGKVCGDAVRRLEKDLDTLLVHYDFPREHWEALRTTNPIERVNKEFKRRAKSMETVSADGLKALLAFTALRLEYGWATTPITSNKLNQLVYRDRLKAAAMDDEKRLGEVERALLH